MKCPRCGSVMIEKPPDIIYTTNPPQWDQIMWCGCGYQENLGRILAKTEHEILMYNWERANKIRRE